MTGAGDGRRPGPRGSAAGVSERLLRLALRAFPREFRSRHREDALAYYADRAAALRARRGRLALAWLLARTVVNVLAEGIRERARLACRPRLGLSELRTAVRALVRRPGFLAASALPIALGIAGAAAIVAVIDGVLLRPLPYPEPDRLLYIGRPLDNGSLATVSTANVLDLEGTLSALDRIGAIQGGSTLVHTDDGPRIVALSRPTLEIFDILGLVPAAGRLPTREETAGSEAALVSWTLAMQWWGSAEAALGRSLESDWRDGTTLHVVGVLPPDFVPPEALGTVATGDVWWPIDPTELIVETTRAFGFARALGRLAPGVTLEAANEQLSAAAERLAEAHPQQNRLRDGTAKGLEGRSLHAETVGDFGARLILLTGAVVGLLLIACANVANLFLSRGIERQRELALRGALGADRGRLALGLVSEAVVVAVAGGVLGIGLAYLSVDALVQIAPDLPRATEIEVHPGVIGASLALTLLTGLLAGLAPLGLVTRHEPGELLHAGRSRHRGSERLRGLLVVGQTALAVVLVTGGGLLVHSAARLGATDLGFNAESILTLRPRGNSLASEQIPATARSITRTLASVPGVERVSGSLFTPGLGLPVTVQVVGTDDAEIDGLPLHRHSVLPDFFETLGIPILEGRGIDSTDDEGGEAVAVVSRSFARRVWGDGSPLGRTFSVQEAEGRDPLVRRVVGVVPDIRNEGPRHEPEPVFYESYLQYPWLPGLEFLVAVRPGVEVVGPLRAALQDAHPDLPLESGLQYEGIPNGIGRLEDLLARRHEEERAYALLLTVFSGLALGIAAVGIYATLSYSVARRFAEIGVRRAVGAGSGDVVRLILRRGVGQAAIGLLLGLGAAAFTAGILSDLLFEITPRDATTYAAVAGILLAVALAACALPARSALRIDPAEVLRQE